MSVHFIPDKHIMRLRAVYFDDKYTNFKLYIDYLVPYNETEELSEVEIDEETR